MVLYTTDLYSNSPDGYAIIDIPDYLKSGYYYEDSNGNVMTYYEYLEKTGAINQNTEIQSGVSSLDDTPDVVDFNTDVT